VAVHQPRCRVVRHFRPPARTRSRSACR
jgi:hypothetical protein